MMDPANEPAGAPKPTDRLLSIADLAGTFLFAIEGATAAVAADLDLLGLMVLAFSTALAGGITRDLLIGAIPPRSLRDWRYPTVAFIGAAIVFFLHPYLEGLPPQPLIVLDAAALALFAVAGTEKALNFHMHPFVAALLGTITAVGGGTIRDVFLAQIPNVLRADVYATAALLGSAIMIASRKLGLSNTASALLGGVACFAIRLISVWQHWNLPHAPT
ncbi:MAG: trimeric intracellular cation channel family protein [Candidatus Acidiferrales bacterium]